MATTYTVSADTMANRIKDDYALMRKEQENGYAATSGTANNGNFFIDTRITRDERRSNNGGEYSYWTEYWHEAGCTFRIERASCDFWQPQYKPEVCEGIVDFTAS